MKKGEISNFLVIALVVVAISLVVYTFFGTQITEFVQDIGSSNQTEQHYEPEPQPEPVEIPVVPPPIQDIPPPPTEYIPPPVPQPEPEVPVELVNETMPDNQTIELINETKINQTNVTGDM